MKVFNLRNPEAARGYDSETGMPSLEYTPRLFLVRGADGRVIEADFDVPPHFMTAGGVGCDPDEISPEDLGRFVRTSLPKRLPGTTVVPRGLTEEQTIAAWRYRSVAEACILRPDCHECAAAVLRSGYDLLVDPLSGERNLCLLRAIVMDGFFARAAPDIPLLVSIFPDVQDRKTIQEMALSAPHFLDNDDAAEYISITGKEPGAERVRASLLHDTVVELLLRREIQTGDLERVSDWMNRDAVSLCALRGAGHLFAAATVAGSVKNARGAQELYEEASRQGNTPLCLALLRRGDVTVDAGRMAPVVKRLQELEVIYRSIVVRNRS